MGSGLIWAGLGKGIADAGTTYGNMMFKAAESELADQRALLKAQALERFKEDLKEQAAQRDADVFSKAQTRGAEIGAQRQEAQLNTDSGKLATNAQTIAGDAPALSQEEMRRHIESLNPAERKALEGTGLVSKAMSPLRQEMQSYDDTITAARELGGSSTLMKSLQESKKERLNEIKAEFKEAGEKEERDQNRRRLDQQDRRLDILDKNADSNRIRAERPPSEGRGATQERLTTQINSANQTIKTLNEGSKGKTPEEKAAWQASMNAAVRLRDSAIAELEQTRSGKKDETPKGGDNSNVKSGPGTIPEPKSQADLSKLSPGTRYKAPDGTIRIKS